MTEVINSWTLKDWTIYPKLHLVQNHQSEFVMKPRLMKLLEFFLIRPNEVVTKEAILEYVWEGRIVTENLITKSISELRKLLNEHFQEDLEIETIRNVGYRFHSKLEILPNTQERPNIVTKKNINRNSNLWSIPLVLAFLGVLGFFLLKKEGTRIEYETKLERVSSLKGQEITPAISPNGQHLAFAWRKSTKESFQIYIRSLVEDNPRKLSQDTFLEFNPVWLPSGDALLFVRRDKAGKRTLIQKSIIGEDELELADFSTYTLRSKMILSKDEKYLIFSAKIASDAPYQLYAFNLKQAEIKPLTTPPNDSYGDVFPSLSQEENQLYFLRAEKGNSLLSNAIPINNQLFSINLETKEESLITKIPEEVKGMAFHSGLGQHLVWVVQQLGFTKLLGIDKEGNKYFIKTVKGGVAEKGVVGANGKFYYEYWQSKVDVFEYPLLLENRSIGKSEEFINSTQWDWGLRFAKEVDKMAFLSYRSGFPEIWLTSTDNPEQATQVTDLKSEMIQSISISPDGKEVAFLKIEDHQSELYVIQSNGQNLQRIRTDSFEYSAPAWSVNGKTLFYSSNCLGTWNIWQYNLARKSEKQITFQGGRVAYPHPTLPNHLLFVKEKADSLWQISLIDQKEIAVCETKGLENFSWIPSGTGIYYLAWQNGICRLLYYDFEDQETQTLKVLEHILPNLPALSISPDGKFLYLAQSNEVNADILALEIKRLPRN